MKTAAELFAVARHTSASDLAGILWGEVDRSLGQAVLRAELALLGNRLEEAETALRLALVELKAHRRMTALLAETLCRAGHLGESALPDRLDSQRLGSRAQDRGPPWLRAHAVS